MIDATPHHSTSAVLRHSPSQSRISIENATPDEGGGPKEISIFCPQTPSIKIADLPRYAKEENECLVLHLSAPDLDSRLVMHCDGEFSAPLGV